MRSVFIRRIVSRLFAALAAIVGAGLASGCASTGAIQQELTDRMRTQDYSGALRLVEDRKFSTFGGRNQLLYFFERGMLLHLDGRYAKSNVAFGNAKTIGLRLYTESLSNYGLSLLSNDYALDYAGENFERTLVHLFSALNYLMLNASDSALVEIRQVDEALRKLQIDSPNENVYQEDAFARYLSALIFEAAGELDSAFVDYKLAVEAYDGYWSNYGVGRPASLLSNAERVARRLGDWAEQDLRLLGGAGRTPLLPEGAGEVFVLHYNGLSPMKDQIRFTIPFSRAWPLALAFQAGSQGRDRQSLENAIAFSSFISGYDVVSVAFPKFVDRPYAITRMRPRATGAFDISTPELVEDIGAIAEKDLADRIVRIQAKTIARAAIKYALQKAAESAARRSSRKHGDWISLATQISGNLARYFSEQADERMWSTLPDKIWMSRVVLPAGRHDIEIDFLDARGVAVESRRLSNLEIVAGSRQFVVVRTVR